MSGFIWLIMSGFRLELGGIQREIKAAMQESL